MPKFIEEDLHKTSSEPSLPTIDLGTKRRLIEGKKGHKNMGKSSAPLSYDSDRVPKSPGHTSDSRSKSLRTKKSISTTPDGFCDNPSQCQPEDRGRYHPSCKNPKRGRSRSLSVSSIHLRPNRIAKHGNSRKRYIRSSTAERDVRARRIEEDVRLGKMSKISRDSGHSIESMGYRSLSIQRCSVNSNSPPREPPYHEQDSPSKKIRGFHRMERSRANQNGEDLRGSKRRFSRRDSWKFVEDHAVVAAPKPSLRKSADCRASEEDHRKRSPLCVAMRSPPRRSVEFWEGEEDNRAPVFHRESRRSPSPRSTDSRPSEDDHFALPSCRALRRTSPRKSTDSRAYYKEDASQQSSSPHKSSESRPCEEDHRSFSPCRRDWRSSPRRSIESQTCEDIRTPPSPCRSGRRSSSRTPHDCQTCREGSPETKRSYTTERQSCVKHRRTSPIRNTRHKMQVHTMCLTSTTTAPWHSPPGIDNEDDCNTEESHRRGHRKKYHKSFSPLTDRKTPESSTSSQMKSMVALPLYTPDASISSSVHMTYTVTGERRTSRRSVQTPTSSRQSSPESRKSSPFRSPCRIEEIEIPPSRKLKSPPCINCPRKNCHCKARQKIITKCRMAGREVLLLKEPGVIPITKCRAEEEKSLVKDVSPVEESTDLSFEQLAEAVIDPVLKYEDQQAILIKSESTKEILLMETAKTEPQNSSNHEIKGTGSILRDPESHHNGQRGSVDFKPMTEMINDDILPYSQQDIKPCENCPGDNNCNCVAHQGRKEFIVKEIKRIMKDLKCSCMDDNTCASDDCLSRMLGELNNLANSKAEVTREKISSPSTAREKEVIYEESKPNEYEVDITDMLDVRKSHDSKTESVESKSKSTNSRSKSNGVTSMKTGSPSGTSTRSFVTTISDKSDGEKRKSSSQVTKVTSSSTPSSQRQTQDMGVGSDEATTENVQIQTSGPISPCEASPSANSGTSGALLDIYPPNDRADDIGAPDSENASDLDQPQNLSGYSEDDGRNKTSTSKVSSKSPESDIVHTPVEGRPTVIPDQLPVTAKKTSNMSAAEARAAPFKSHSGTASPVERTSGTSKTTADGEEGRLTHSRSRTPGDETRSERTPGDETRSESPSRIPGGESEHSEMVEKEVFNEPESEDKPLPDGDRPQRASRSSSRNSHPSPSRSERSSLNKPSPRRSQPPPEPGVYGSKGRKSFKKSVEKFSASLPAGEKSDYEDSTIQSDGSSPRKIGSALSRDIPSWDHSPGSSRSPKLSTKSGKARSDAKQPSQGPEEVSKHKPPVENELKIDVTPQAEEAPSILRLSQSISPASESSDEYEPVPNSPPEPLRKDLDSSANMQSSVEDQESEEVPHPPKEGIQEEDSSTYIPVNDVAQRYNSGVTTGGSGTSDSAKKPSMKSCQSISGSMTKNMNENIPGESNDLHPYFETSESAVSPSRGPGHPSEFESLPHGQTHVETKTTEPDRASLSGDCNCRKCIGTTTCHCCGSCPCSNRRKPEDTPRWVVCDLYNTPIIPMGESERQRSSPTAHSSAKDSKISHSSPTAHSSAKDSKISHTSSNEPSLPKVSVGSPSTETSEPLFKRTKLDESQKSRRSSSRQRRGQSGSDSDDASLFGRPTPQRSQPPMESLSLSPIPSRSIPAIEDEFTPSFSDDDGNHLKQGRKSGSEKSSAARQSETADDVLCQRSEAPMWHRRYTYRSVCAARDKERSRSKSANRYRSASRRRSQPSFGEKQSNKARSPRGNRSLTDRLSDRRSRRQISRDRQTVSGGSPESDRPQIKFDRESKSPSSKSEGLYQDGNRQFEERKNLRRSKDSQSSVGNRPRVGQRSPSSRGEEMDRSPSQFGSPAEYHGGRTAYRRYSNGGDDNSPDTRRPIEGKVGSSAGAQPTAGSRSSEGQTSPRRTPSGGQLNRTPSQSPNHSSSRLHSRRSPKTVLNNEGSSGRRSSNSDDQDRRYTRRTSIESSPNRRDLQNSSDDQERGSTRRSVDLSPNQDRNRRELQHSGDDQHSGVTRRKSLEVNLVRRESRYSNDDQDHGSTRRRSVESNPIHDPTRRQSRHSNDDQDHGSTRGKSIESSPIHDPTRRESRHSSNNDQENGSTRRKSIGSSFVHDPTRRESRHSNGDQDHGSTRGKRIESGRVHDPTRRESRHSNDDQDRRSMRGERIESRSTRIQVPHQMESSYPNDANEWAAEGFSPIKTETRQSYSPIEYVKNNEEITQPTYAMYVLPSERGGALETFSERPRTRRKDYDTVLKCRSVSPEEFYGDRPVPYSTLDGCSSYLSSDSLDERDACVDRHSHYDLRRRESSCSTVLSDDADWNMVAVRPAGYKIRGAGRFHKVRPAKRARPRCKYPRREEDRRQRSEGSSTTINTFKTTSRALKMRNRCRKPRERTISSLKLTSMDSPSTVSDGSEIYSSISALNTTSLIISDNTSLVTMPPLDNDDDYYETISIESLPRTPLDVNDSVGSLPRNPLDALASASDIAAVPDYDNGASRNSIYMGKDEEENGQESEMPKIQEEGNNPWITKKQPKTEVALLQSVEGSPLDTRKSPSGASHHSQIILRKDPSVQRSMMSYGGSTVTNIHTKKYECGCQEIVREYTTTIDGGCGKEACPCGCSGAQDLSEVPSPLPPIASMNSEYAVPTSSKTQEGVTTFRSKSGSICYCDNQAPVLHCPDEKPCDCNFNCDCPQQWQAVLDPEFSKTKSRSGVVHCPDEKPCDCNFPCDCEEVWRKSTIREPTVTRESPSRIVETTTVVKPNYSKLHCPDEKACDCPYKCDCESKWPEMKGKMCPVDRECDCSPCTPGQTCDGARSCDCIAWDEEPVHKDTQTSHVRVTRVRSEAESQPYTSEEPSSYSEVKPVFDRSPDEGSTTCRLYPYGPPATTSSSQVTSESECEPGCCKKFFCCMCGSGKKKKKTKKKKEKKKKRDTSKTSKSSKSTKSSKKSKSSKKPREKKPKKEKKKKEKTPKKKKEEKPKPPKKKKEKKPKSPKKKKEKVKKRKVKKCAKDCPAECTP